MNAYLRAKAKQVVYQRTYRTRMKSAGRPTRRDIENALAVAFVEQALKSGQSGAVSVTQICAAAMKRLVRKHYDAAASAEELERVFAAIKIEKDAYVDISNLAPLGS